MVVSIFGRPEIRACASFFLLRRYRNPGSRSIRAMELGAGRVSCRSSVVAGAINSVAGAGRCCRSPRRWRRGCAGDGKCQQCGGPDARLARRGMVRTATSWATRSAWRWAGAARDGGRGAGAMILRSTKTSVFEASRPG